MGDDNESGGVLRRKVDVGLITLILTMLMLLGQNIWRESRDAAEKDAMRGQQDAMVRATEELSRSVQSLQIAVAEIRVQMAAIQGREGVAR